MTLSRIPELRRVLVVLVAAALPGLAFALPEDDAQPIDSENYASLNIDLDAGEWVQKAHANRPTCIRQGTRLICGDEIRFERAEDGSIRKVTASGDPARFEQQPEADQEIAYFTGATLILDNEARLLTIDGKATWSQGPNSLSHERIEYHLDERTLDANAGDGDGDASGQMRILPPQQEREGD